MKSIELLLALNPFRGTPHRVLMQEIYKIPPKKQTIEDKARLVQLIFAVRKRGWKLEHIEGAGYIIDREQWLLVHHTLQGGSYAHWEELPTPTQIFKAYKLLTNVIGERNGKEKDGQKDSQKETG